MEIDCGHILGVSTLVFFVYSVLAYRTVSTNTLAHSMDSDLPVSTSGHRCCRDLCFFSGIDISASNHFRLAQPL